MSTLLIDVKVLCRRVICMVRQATITLLSMEDWLDWQPHIRRGGNFSFQVSPAFRLSINQFFERKLEVQFRKKRLKDKKKNKCEEYCAFVDGISEKNIRKFR